MFKLKIPIAAILLILPLLACGDDYQRASIIALIGQPELYKGKKVMISGYLKIKHEGDAIYLGKEDAEYALSENAVWLDLKPEQIKKWQPLTDSYATVFGEYAPNSDGHFDLFSGSLINVFQIHQMPDFKKIREELKNSK